MKNKKTIKSKPYDDKLLEDLKDNEFATIYLNSCINGLSDDDFEVFFSALSTVVKARGVSKVAENGGITRDALYKVFKSHKNPTVISFRKILNAIGLEIAIVPKVSIA